MCNRRIRRVGVRRFVVAEEKPVRVSGHLVEYTTTLPDVKDEDFKPRQHLFRNFSMTAPHFGVFNLEHRFLKRVRSKDTPNQYVWQIRILDGSGVTIFTTEEQVFEKLDGEVSGRLAPFGSVVSRTILKEIAAAESR